MTEPIKEQAREVARGEDEKTPWLALGGVTATIAVVAGILIAVVLFLWWYLAR